MSDKVRGALFNALGDIVGLTILDAFAGSGALSFEAISRGAKFAIAIEQDKSAHQTIKSNIKELQLSDGVKAIRANVSGWSDNNPNVEFDVVLLDPPHDNLQPNLINKIATAHTKINGILALSLPPGTENFLERNFVLLDSKHYGDIQLVFYRRTE